MVICVDGICDNLKKNTRGNFKTIVNSVCLYDSRIYTKEKFSSIKDRVSDKLCSCYFTNHVQVWFQKKIIKEEIIRQNIYENDVSLKLIISLFSGLITSCAVDPWQCWMTCGTSDGALVCWDLRFHLPITKIIHPQSMLLLFIIFSIQQS